MIASPIAGIRKSLSDFRDSVSSLESRRDHVRSQRKEAEEAVRTLKYSADLNQRSSEVFKQWLEEELDSSVNSMSDLVTTGLKFVIDDQDLKFKIQQELKYNRLSMRFLIEDGGVEGDPMTGFGGGAVLLASLILRVSVMTRMNMGNLLILDESMFAMANKYIPATADFMRRLSEETGINIFMVTHNDEFMSNAHVAYEASVTKDPDTGLKSLRLKKRG